MKLFDDDTCPVAATLRIIILIVCLCGIFYLEYDRIYNSNTSVKTESITTKSDSIDSCIDSLKNEIIIRKLK